MADWAWRDTMLRILIYFVIFLTQKYSFNWYTENAIISKIYISKHLNWVKNVISENFTCLDFRQVKFLSCYENSIGKYLIHILFWRMGFADIFKLRDIDLPQHLLLTWINLQKYFLEDLSSSVLFTLRMSQLQLLRMEINGFYSCHQ